MTVLLDDCRSRMIIRIGKDVVMTELHESLVLRVRASYLQQCHQVLFLCLQSFSRLKRFYAIHFSVPRFVCTCEQDIHEEFEQFWHDVLSASNKSYTW